MEQLRILFWQRFTAHSDRFCGLIRTPAPRRKGSRLHRKHREPANLGQREIGSFSFEWVVLKRTMPPQEVKPCSPLSMFGQL